MLVDERRAHAKIDACSPMVVRYLPSPFSQEYIELPYSSGCTKALGSAFFPPPSKRPSEDEDRKMTVDRSRRPFFFELIDHPLSPTGCLRQKLPQTSFLLENGNHLISGTSCLPTIFLPGDSSIAATYSPRWRHFAKSESHR